MDPSGTVLPWAAPASDFDHHHNRPMESYNMNTKPVSQPAGMPRPTATIVQVCADVKPRLTKDQHEILEQHFRQQPKPSTTVKKGFADALGVPLDKINNWFQNRRAKVKQDAKKQLNSMQLYSTFGHHSQQYLPHAPQVAPQLPFHYGPLPVVPSNTEPPVEGAAASPTTMTVQNPNMQPNMPPAEFSMQPPVMTSAPNGMNFEAQAFPPTMAGQQMMLQDFNFEPAFGDDFMSMPENFEFMMPTSGPVPVTMAQFPDNALLTPPTDNASPNTMPQLTSAYTHPSQSDNEKIKYNIDSPQDLVDLSASTGHPTPAESTTTWSTQGPDMYEQQNASAPGLIQGQASPESVNSYERRESSALAESMNSVVFDCSSSESESSFKAPSQISGLAARRQKPRPANLISTALRSASYTAGMSGSPSANANPNAQDQLRRIRSHGVGIATGKISKPYGPQKSPLHANFDSAALNSPKFARHASNYSVSTINSSGPLTATTMPGSLAPPTPITPNEYSRFPIGQGPGFSFPTGSPGAFSHMGEDSIYLDTTPPMSKLDMHQMEQFRASQMARHDASLFHTPPQSAPAFQQHFGFTPPSMQPRMLQPPPSHGMGHVRRTSLPNAGHEQEHNGPFQQQPLMQPGQGMQPPFNLQLNEAFQIPHGMPIPAECVGDMSFMVPQQMRMPADSRLPVHFHNQTPEDFQSAARSK